MMKGILTFTIAPGANSPEALALLQEQIAAMGLGTTLPDTDRDEVLRLPEGTYAGFVQIDDQMEQLQDLYRSLVEIMRDQEIKGKYFINLASQPTYVCGEL
jgi:hypothetical protein